MLENFKLVNKIEKKLIDDEKKTVEVIMSDETVVKRYSWQKDKDYNLKLLHGKDNVDLSRADILKVFYDHETYYNMPFGFYTNVRLENNQLKATANFDPNDEEAMKLFEKIKHGSISTVSVGVKITKQIELENGDIEVEEWGPIECSFAPIPANPNAKVSLNLKGEFDMTKEELKQLRKEEFQKGVASEKLRMSAIEKLKGGEHDKLIEKMANEGVNIEDIKTALINENNLAYQNLKKSHKSANDELDEKLTQLDDSDGTAPKIKDENKNMETLLNERFSNE